MFELLQENILDCECRVGLGVIFKANLGTKQKIYKLLNDDKALQNAKFGEVMHVILDVAVTVADKLIRELVYGDGELTPEAYKIIGEFFQNL